MRVILELDVMPENCSVCPLVAREGVCIYWCKATKEDCENPFKCRNTTCKLKEE